MTSSSAAGELQHVTVTNAGSAFGPIDIHAAVLAPQSAPEAPLIVCVHGWPETWHSWRAQMEFFAARGLRVAAIDVRGYGSSSRPTEIAAYRLSELAGDVAAVIDALSPGAPAILFGHDWGSPIVHTTARIHADKVKAVAALSVPYTPTGPGDPMEFWDLVYPDSFFYMRYFQEPGVAEAAFDADLGAAIRKIYYAASADAPRDAWHKERPKNYAILDDLVDPDPAPAWMSAEALAPALEAHAMGGLHGAFNRYRAQALDGEDIPNIGEPTLRQPTCFIGGEFDVVRNMVPGVDPFTREPDNLADYRGTTIIANAGHWVQQEQPDATNEALATFVDAVTA